jgi:hypothetical protein
MARSEVLNVYINEISPRANWVFKLIFEDILGLGLHMTDDRHVLTSSGNPAVNYSNTHIDGIPSVTPAGLLSETGVRAQQIELREFNDLPVFFHTEGSDLPFDPFSMAFYLVSRYEEYLPFTPDKHGRFPYTESLANKAGFLNIPVVNHLAGLLKILLLKYYPDLKVPEGKYNFLPTVDVDIAFAHLGKGFIRTYGAMTRLLLKGQLKEIRSRIRTMRGKARDPYDNIDFLTEVFKKHNLKPVFFILAGDPGPFDRNLSLRNNKFVALIRELDDKADLGVHPSYRSGEEPQRVKTEIDRINEVTRENITKSRQHFVRLKFPDTYNNLIGYGIKEDYSMGYAAASGFRASIATPFRFYDIMEEKETELLVYPFAFMDTTLSDYMGLSPDCYLEAVKPIIREVMDCKGTLCGIWHNYAIADDQEKQNAFREIIKLAAGT